MDLLHPSIKYLQKKSLIQLTLGVLFPIISDLARSSVNLWHTHYLIKLPLTCLKGAENPFLFGTNYNTNTPPFSLTYLCYEAKVPNLAMDLRLKSNSSLYIFIKND